MRLSGFTRFHRAFAFASVCVLVVPALAIAVGAPHVTSGTVDTPTCAMCHRSHESPSDGWSEHGWPDTTSAALLAVPSSGLGDTEMCFTCHGLAQLGSNTDIEGAFTSQSRHSLTPSPTAYGPKGVMQCSSCHDAHGSDRDASDTPRPALLRVITTTGTSLYSGEEYCANCHADRPLDKWDGLAVFRSTPHSSKIATPTSGTNIVCSNCHDPHGSNNPPSIVTSLMPPAAPATTSILANDRTLCVACHPLRSYTYSGPASYAVSAHGGSVVTATLPGEYPSRDYASLEASRKVGECQNCHAPMGRSDGASGTIPKLVDRRGRQVCDQCHDASGPARSNIASLASLPSTDSEIVAVWRPSVETSIYGDTAVYTRDVTVTVPAALDGPRVFPSSGRTGDAAAGDIDDDGDADLVVADPSRAVVDVYMSDPVRGLQRTLVAVPDGVVPALVEVADVVFDGTGPHGAADKQAEIAIVARDAGEPHASRLYVYRYSAGTLTALDIDAGAEIYAAVGNDASSIVAGDVTGTSVADLVVSSAGSNAFRIFSQSGSTLGPAAGPFGAAVLSRPRGISVGDIWADEPGNEIVLCNAITTAGANDVDIFNEAGTLLGSLSVPGHAGAEVAYDTAIGDVLYDGSNPGAELIVTLRSDPTTDVIASTSSISVFRQSAGTIDTGVGQPLRYDTGTLYESSSLAVGEVDGDTRVELVVGNAGKWLRFGNRKAPSLQVFDSTDGTSLGSPRTLWSTGVEQASGLETTSTILGAAPSVVIADLGAVGPARHPGDAGSATHVSTETAPIARHVTCADCHNPHETTATVSGTAPNVYGALKGAWGVTVTNNGPGNDIAFSQNTSVTREYEVCLKCHSANAVLGTTRNVAAEVNIRNASAHGVEGPSTVASAPAGTFVGKTAGSFISTGAAWTKGSTVYCADCHRNSNTAQAKGPHVSDYGSLLRGPLWGTLSGDSDLFCYLCHKNTVYYSGTEDLGASASLFQHPPRTEQRMHKLHTNDGGFSCRTCHVSHGSPSLLHMHNTEHNYEHTQTGGACTTACHVNGARRVYTRQATTFAPASFAVTAGAGFSGTVSAMTSRDATEVLVLENNTTPGYSINITFTPVGSMPAGVEFRGWYEGSANHNVAVQAFNFTTGTWATLGSWPHGAAASVYTWPLANSAYLSGGTVWLRVQHTSPGNPTEKLHIDSVWLYQ